MIAMTTGDGIATGLFGLFWLVAVLVFASDRMARRIRRPRPPRPCAHVRQERRYPNVEPGDSLCGLVTHTCLDCGFKWNTPQAFHA